jgi:sulfite exporter TauE/SafE
MCGAFVCFYANDNGATSWRSDAGAHAAYNIGRLVSYLSLGLAAGAVGSALDRAGGLAGVGNVAAIAAGVLMIGWGINAMLVARGAGHAITVPAAWQHAMGGALQRLRDRSPVVRAAATGLLTTLLPCGWLYAFVVTAGGAGTPLRGALVMLVFWAGTLPMMLAVGFGAQRLFGPLRARLPMVSAGVIVFLGLFSIANHFGLIPGMQWMHDLTVAVPAASTAAITTPMAGH